MMQDIYLTPASISYLTQSILALVITGYFAYRTWSTPRVTRQSHTVLLIGFFTSITLFSLLLFLEASLPRGEDLYAIFFQNTILGGGLVLLLQFAYRFPTLSPRKKWEARLVLGLSIAYVLWEFQFAVHRFQLLGAGQVIWRPEYADYPLAIGLLWVPVTFARQAMVSSDPLGPASLARLRYVWHPQGHNARAARALALVYLIPFGLSLINLLTGFYVFSRTLYHVSMSLGILIALVTFAVVYLDHLPETTSFIVKLDGVMLVALLAVLGTIGWVIAPIYAAQYCPVLPDQRTIRFMPNVHGGYVVTEVPFHFERELGTDLELTDTYERWAVGLDLDFVFPFYGRTYQKIYVSNDGVISLGQNVRYTYLHYRYGGGAPIIFPLFLDLSPIPGSGGVFVRQDAGRLIVTWDRIPAFYRPEAVFTFQLILYPDGVFEIAYDDLPEHVPFRPNDEPGASPWVVGIVPGVPSTSAGESPGQRPQEVDFTALPLESDARGIVQDYQLGFRRHLQQLLVSLAYLIIGSSVLVVAGFPILLNANLVRPLDALLKGVQQMNAGRYDVSVHIQYPDEIGFLTQSFNKMSAELSELIHNLEARVTKRTQDLEAARLEAERANLAKSVFLANMSHELRTPLNAVLGFSELMTRDPSLTHDQQENLAIIGRSGEHLLGLINDVLELSKIEAGRVKLEPESFDLHRMLLGLGEMFSLRAEEKGLTLVFDFEPDVPQRIRADQNKLRQVLINLLGNAIKFTHRGGITLRVAFSPLFPPPTGESEGPKLHFEIQDTGVGIAPEELDKVFDAFVQTSSGQQSKQGTGLGIPISQKFVQMMGGDLTVSSTVGKGTTFKFDVSVEVVDVAQVQDAQTTRRVVGLEPGQHAVDGGPYRLLIVEDVEANSKLLVGLLQPLGFEVREASDGQQAIAVWQEWKPHLIWMDIRIPVMDGREVIRRIKATPQGQDTIIVALTANVFEEERERVLAEGCDDFVRKPFRETVILEVLTKHLGVRFIYQDIESQREHVPVVQTDVEVSSLAGMPPEWLADLHQATVEGDLTRMESLIMQIQEQHPSIASTLMKMAHNFEHDAILALIGN
ncbi:MAG: response regulator [Anaerolineae bacterium]|nr:response regulator [Anaerolineae bacterium]